MRKKFIIFNVSTDRYWIGRPWRDYEWGRNPEDAASFNSIEEAESEIFKNDDNGINLNDYIELDDHLEIKTMYCKN